jgi:hypothetical protein
MEPLIKSYSQCGQDIFVYNILKKNKGYYLDLGCYLPKKINNTYLLELNGWDGISVDIMDYHNEWKDRKNKFIQTDCLSLNYDEFLDKYYNQLTIDYLSLDMELLGDRYKLLQKIFESKYDFKVITIEHDSYMGENFIINEKQPQVDFLKNNGYILVCSDVAQSQHPTLYYEDWWVNSKYFNEDEIKLWFSNKESCDKIFDKLNIKYEIADESKSW